MRSLPWFLGACVALAHVGCGSDSGGGTGGSAGSGATGGSGGSGGSVISTEHPRIYWSDANRQRLKSLLDGNDAAVVRFKNWVDSALSGADPYAFEAWHSAFIGELTQDPKYCADAVKRADAELASEEARIANGSAPDVAGDDYLDVGPRVGSLMMVLDFCYDEMSATQRSRFIAYANQAVWNVWHPDAAVWGGASHPWNGWATDNPSNNYYYSFLKATLLLGLASKGENPDADQWIDKFRKEKIGAELVPTFEKDLVGGGSREGTGYGVAMKGLFWLYEVWQASTGENIANLTPHSRESMAYLVHSTVPTLDRVAPLGDHSRDSTAALFDYHREYGAALAWLHRDDPLAKPLATWLRDCSVPKMDQGFEFVYDAIYRNPNLTEEPLSKLRTTYFAPGTGHLFARSDWGEDATFVGFVMGPYTESHAHHDQLSFLIYDGEWLAYDANIESHSGLSQSVRAHNLVRLEKSGKALEQSDGHASVVLALHDEAEFLYAAADATPVYTSAGVTRVEREIVYLKPSTLVVYDRVDAGSGANYVWQLTTPLTPALSGTHATAGALDVFGVVPASGAFSVVDMPSEDSDYQAGNRLERHVAADGASQLLHVLSVGGAVASVSAANQGNDDGVSIAFANGGSATVRFHRTTTGGTLTSSGAAGTFDGPLPSGVQVPEVFAP